MWLLRPRHFSSQVRLKVWLSYLKWQLTPSTEKVTMNIRIKSSTCDSGLNTLLFHFFLPLCIHASTRSKLSRKFSIGIVIKFNSLMGWLELFKFPERNYVFRKNRGWSHRQASFDVQTLRTQCPWRELQLPFFVYLTKTFYFNWKFIIVIWIFFTGSKCRKKAKKLHSRYLANPMAEYMHFSHHKDGELDSAYKEYKTIHYKKFTSPVEHEQRKHIFKHNLRWYLFWQV